MSRATFAAWARQKQYVHMEDEATVTRATSAPIFDPNTGTYGQPSSTVYEGRCEIGGPNRGVSSGFDVEVGRTELRLMDLPAKFPVGTAVAKDDLVTVTASLHNPGLVGKVYRVTDVPPVRVPIYCHVTLEEVVDG